MNFSLLSLFCWKMNFDTHEESELPATIVSVTILQIATKLAVSHSSLFKRSILKSLVYI